MEDTLINRKITIMYAHSIHHVCRRKLQGYLDNPNGHRDAFLVDVWLDSWFKVQLDKVNFRDLQVNIIVSQSGTYIHGPSRQGQLL